MIRKIGLGVLLLVTSIFVSAQIIDPVKVTESIKKIGDNEYEVALKATIDDKWHLYSMDEQEAGLPTEVNFLNQEGNYELVDTIQIDGEKIEEYSDVFMANLRYYSHEVTFRQKIKITNPDLKEIKTGFFYQVCDDSKCLAPENKDFTLNLDGSKGGDTPVIASGETLKLASIDIDNPINDCGEHEEKDNSLLGTFLKGFLGGFIALLMPCIFPLIPLTVSFFTKGSENKGKGLFKAGMYGFFIIAIFLLFSVPFHILGGVDPELFNNISTNIWLNLFFAIIFIVFAISFFGYFELTLPSSWANKIDNQSEKAGLFGPFFMALTLVIVSFSCTGPILGTLLVDAIQAPNGATQLTMGMFGFGLALALPFTLSAFFPSILNSLPRSGGWMTTLKVIIGFIELALALKFLSKADLVGFDGPMGLLKKEVFLVIWIIIFVGLALYLFKRIFFPHDNKLDKSLGFARISFGVLVVAFIVYLASGLTPNSNLKALSGLIPPSNYSLFNNQGKENHTDGFELKHGIKIIDNDLDRAFELAKKENKPVLIDFTGYGCENCRRMEDNVWIDPEILSILKNDVIVVSLYVDSSEELPIEEQKEVYVEIQNKNKLIKTVGNKWATFQTENFKNNSQPNYALLTADGKLLNRDIRGYKDVEEFKAFLECGLGTFESLK
ncbi:protein-disulfide reductase [Flavobacteriaceae bacterium UJ101]|nr:protein-disulfide reductase [Flavobacteriaceae bacterium UJ101]